MSFAIGNSTSDFESVISKSANYTIVETVDSLIVLVTTGSSANVTITMPAASAYAGKKIKIVKQDSGTKFVAIARAGSDTIRGSATSLYLIQQGESAEFTPSSADWVLLGDPMRTVTAAISHDGTDPSIGSQYPTWITSVAKNLSDVGDTTGVIVTGVFLSNPEAANANSTSYWCAQRVISIATTSFRVYTYTIDASHTPIGKSFNLSVTGRR